MENHEIGFQVFLLVLLAAMALVPCWHPVPDGAQEMYSMAAGAIIALLRLSGSSKKGE